MIIRLQWAWLKVVDATSGWFGTKKILWDPWKPNFGLWPRDLVTAAENMTLDVGSVAHLSPRKRSYC